MKQRRTHLEAKIILIAMTLGWIAYLIIDILN